MCVRRLHLCGRFLSQIFNSSHCTGLWVASNLGVCLSRDGGKMFRLSRTHLSKWLLVLAVAEFGAILLSFYAGLYFSWVEFGWKLEETVDALPSALFYAVVLQTTVFALGATLP